jgi:putative peptide zinc metalloprotease protein
MIPVGGATKRHPGLFVIRGDDGKPVAILSTTAPDPSGAPSAGAAGGATSTSGAAPSGAPPSASTDAAAFPFALPKPPGPGGTQALAENTTNGSVKYDIAYALVTVSGGHDVTNTNSAFALAHCTACTTVAVSFQVVLVIGQSHLIAPINAAGALNYNCLACVTTALADQLVVTLKSQPSQQLLSTLNTYLKRLNLLPKLGRGGNPAAVAAQVEIVQHQIETALQASGLETNPPAANSTSSGSGSGGGPTGTSSTTTPATSTPTTPAAPSGSTPAAPSGSTPTTPSTSTPTPPSSTSSTTPSSTSTAPSTTSTTSSSTGSTTTGTTSTTTSTTPSG